LRDCFERVATVMSIAIDQVKEKPKIAL